MVSTPLVSKPRSASLRGPAPCAQQRSEESAKVAEARAQVSPSILAGSLPRRRLQRHLADGRRAKLCAELAIGVGASPAPAAPGQRDRAIGAVGVDAAVCRRIALAEPAERVE